MIQGIYGEDGELFFEITLIANNGLEFSVDAWLDTGFSGWLLMDSQDLQELEWTYFERQTMMTAKGETDFRIYLGQVKLDEQISDIPVHVGDGVGEFLLGRKWLKSRRLLVDMASGILTLGT